MAQVTRKDKRGAHPIARKDKRGENAIAHKDKKKTEANPDFKAGVTWQSGGKTYKGIVLSGPEDGMYAIGIVSPHVGPGECIVHAGDNVHVLMRDLEGEARHHEAIVLEREYNLYTLAAHVYGPDGQLVWTIVPRRSLDMLGPERLRPARFENRVVRGALCRYATRDFVARAVVLDYRRVGSDRAVYELAYRSLWGWEIARNVSPAEVSFV